MVISRASFRKNLIKLNYEFVYLSINGSKQGLYVLEENFGKELIERTKKEMDQFSHYYLNMTGIFMILNLKSITNNTEPARELRAS